MLFSATEWATKSNGNSLYCFGGLWDHHGQQLERNSLVPSTRLLSNHTCHWDFLFHLLFFSCVWVFYLHLFLCRPCVQCPQSPVQEFRSSESGITDHCKIPCGCRGSNPGCLEEQPVLLMSEPSLQVNAIGAFYGF